MHKRSCLGQLFSSSKAFGPIVGIICFVKFVRWCDVQKKREAARARKALAAIDAAAAKRENLIQTILAERENKKPAIVRNPPVEKKVTRSSITLMG